MAKKVLLIMKRKILSDTLIGKVEKGSCFELSAEHNYALAVLTAEAYLPDITVLEIPESGPWKPAEKCLLICDMIRKQLPNCKQVVLCNETDGDSRRAAINAKQNRRIDDFLFYESSVNYLLSKLEALA